MGGCRILCKSVDNGVACEEEWPDYWPAEGEYCNYSEIGNIEANGYQASYFCSHEISETISERAKVGVPLIVQGDIGVSWGREGILNETCEVANVQVDVFIYKDNLELYSETLYTDEYGDWESNVFMPNETGEYKFAMRWPQGNIFPDIIWANAEFFFNVTE